MKKSFDDYEYLKTNDEPFTCPVCRREVPLEFQEKHHLVPKSKKGKETIILCRSCGDQLHKLFTNKQLEKTYKTIEAILSNEDVQRWILWISKKPMDFRICMATKKKR